MSDAQVEVTTLDNGIRVVTERMESVRSVTTGFWVGVGARDEADELSGASHFLEHLLFKGTEQRTAREIAESVDAVGGEMNAFTTKEYTAYYTRLPATELAFGLDLLCDVVSAPAFRPGEIDAERQVILEEILMNEDTPDDRVHTLLFEALFPGHPLGREVLGTPETIEAMAREAIADFHGEHYRPTNLVVAAAGDLHHDAVVEQVAERYPDGAAGEAPVRGAPTGSRQPVAVQTRSTEQVHLALGWPGVDHHDDDRYALGVANHVLGGGTASRLFQEVREERGLAYAVFSSASSFADSGAVTVYAGTAPSRVTETLQVIRGVVGDLVATGPTDQEVDVAKGYLEGSLVIGLEDSGSRMGRLGSNLVIRGEVPPLDEQIERIRAVERDDLRRVIGRVFDEPPTLAAVGPISGSDLDLPS
ncbi:MAG TPA: pitrilysin family protein [Acidimicrobiales bacterium]|nr:pitrilysin family protein [Acidimicrobiales bacterium]